MAKVVLTLFILGCHTMEIGKSIFAETTPKVVTGETVLAERLRKIVEEIKLADAVGLDIYGIRRKHHHAAFATSPPAVILAAAAMQSKTE